MSRENDHPLRSKEMIAGIILAAGSSARMGSPKALLKIGDKTFIRRIVGQLRAAGVETIITVLGANAAAIEKELEGLNVAIAVNENPAAGQLLSLQKGIAAVTNLRPEGILLCLVDHPAFSASTVTALMESFRRDHCRAVIPTYKGRRGHPVLISSKLFDEIVEAPDGTRMSDIIRRHDADVREIETADEGVVLDIDTPEDLKRIP